MYLAAQLELVHDWENLMSAEIVKFCLSHIGLYYSR